MCTVRGSMPCLRQYSTTAGSATEAWQRSTARATSSNERRFRQLRNRPANEVRPPSSTLADDRTTSGVPRALNACSRSRGEHTNSGTQKPARCISASVCALPPATSGKNPPGVGQTEAVTIRDLAHLLHVIGRQPSGEPHIAQTFETEQNRFGRAAVNLTGRKRKPDDLHILLERQSRHTACDDVKIRPGGRGPWMNARRDREIADDRVPCKVRRTERRVDAVDCRNPDVCVANGCRVHGHVRTRNPLRQVEQTSFGPRPSAAEQDYAAEVGSKDLRAGAADVAGCANHGERRAAGVSIAIGTRTFDGFARQRNAEAVSGRQADAARREPRSVARHDRGVLTERHDRAAERCCQIDSLLDEPPRNVEATLVHEPLHPGRRKRQQNRVEANPLARQRLDVDDAHDDWSGKPDELIEKTLASFDRHAAELRIESGQVVGVDEVKQPRHAPARPIIVALTEPDLVVSTESGLGSYESGLVARLAVLGQMTRQRQCIVATQPRTDVLDGGDDTRKVIILDEGGRLQSQRESVAERRSHA